MERTELFEVFVYLLVIIGGLTVMTGMCIICTLTTEFIIASTRIAPPHKGFTSDLNSVPTEKSRPEVFSDVAIV